MPTFRLLAELSGQVPLVAVVSGYCFAGNAALAGACDVIIATEGSSLGMGGPAMIEGGGLGVVAPADVGPMSVQVPNGVVDVLVPGDAAAVAAARAYLGYVAVPGDPPPGAQSPAARPTAQGRPQAAARARPQAPPTAMLISGSCATWCRRTGFAPTTSARSSRPCSTGGRC